MFWYGRQGKDEAFVKTAFVSLLSKKSWEDFLIFGRNSRNLSAELIPILTNILASVTFNNSIFEISAAATFVPGWSRQICMNIVLLLCRTGHILSWLVLWRPEDLLWSLHFWSDHHQPPPFLHPSYDYTFEDDNLTSLEIFIILKRLIVRRQISESILINHTTTMIIIKSSSSCHRHHHDPGKASSEVAFAIWILATGQSDKVQR